MPSLKPIIIAGIGTDVGKTLVSAIVVKALCAEYWKPIQCGSLEATDTMRIRSLVDLPDLICREEAYTFKHPVSPHYTAELENRAIDPQNLIPKPSSTPLVIECAGGLLVPYSAKLLQIDALRGHECHVILVSRHYLGSINHTLLTIEALRCRGCRLAGIVFNGTDRFGAEKVITDYAQAPFIARLDEEPGLSDPQYSRTIINRYANQWKPKLSCMLHKAS